MPSFPRRREPSKSRVCGDMVLFRAAARKGWIPACVLGDVRISISSFNFNRLIQEFRHARA